MSCLTSVERLKTQDLTKFGKIGKTANLGGDIAQCPVSLPEIKLWQQQYPKIWKNRQNVSFSVQFYWIFFTLAKYFLWDFRFSDMHL